MIDADVVTIDDRVFLAVGREVSADAGKIRERECIQVILRKARKPAAARTVAQIITRNRSAVRSEDRADRCRDFAATGKLILAGRSRLQQLAEIANTHSRRRHRHTERIARATKNRRTVSLPVQREEEERTVATVIQSRTTFTKVRQEDWTTDGAVEVMSYVVRHRR